MGLAEIAEVVGISAPALYKHFRSKQDLLCALLEDELAALDEALAVGGGDIYDALATFAAERTAFGVLWQRERPKVDSADRARFDERMAALRDRVTIGTTGEPVLTRAMLSVVESTTYYADRPDRTAQRAALRNILVAVGGTSGLTTVCPPVVAASGPLLSARPWLSRRQAILILAPQLTQVRGGYDDVTMEDLGTAAGMSGAAAYHYFPSKADVFQAAFAQAASWGQAMLEQAWTAATSPDDMLDRVLAGAVRLSKDFPAIIRTALNNTVELPEPQRVAALAGAAQYTGEWQRCLAVVRPDLSKEDIEVLTFAVLAMIGDLAGPTSGDNVVVPAADLVVLARRVVLTGVA
ncbi:TetR family transcriptional regulator [Virgisporangium aurantiacum]|uniref:TetR family transcriptional regulator n=1 Tax=Virgisporangium aurantiacum TaxID=175570 RepID=A0A8J3ZMJ3_9ACTN|nr:TetR family transcriptional regulator [Virgisporangium aurantiacum]